MLKLKALLAKILSWAGFTYDWSYFSTNNTTDTWVPVTSAEKVYHRVIPRGLIYDMSTQGKNQAATVAGNGYPEVVVDIASLVNGYSWALNYINFSNRNVIVTNYWTSGATIHVVCRNLTGSQQTGNVQLNILRWKSAT